ncbi:MAG: hypothetical protein KIT11_04520 [Fimbriimonadaceae bacterium]|nr:hypothetical protein [Fimbriimonadaceae bacterium]QYK56842.1 MAG: hypothetical protein KF733_05005 [Fimbriimonadaceae bacterium]
MNPGRWDQAVDVANLMGIRSICMFNVHRERLVSGRFGLLNLTARPDLR